MPILSPICQKTKDSLCFFLFSFQINPMNAEKKGFYWKRFFECSTAEHINIETPLNRKFYSKENSINIFSKASCGPLLFKKKSLHHKQTTLPTEKFKKWKENEENFMNDIELNLLYFKVENEIEKISSENFLNFW